MNGKIDWFGIFLRVGVVFCIISLAWVMYDQYIVEQHCDNIIEDLSCRGTRYDYDKIRCDCEVKNCDMVNGTKICIENEVR